MGSLMMIVGDTTVLPDRVSTVHNLDLVVYQ